jgi:hypothetical protein
MELEKQHQSSNIEGVMMQVLDEKTKKTKILCIVFYTSLLDLKNER